MSTDLLPSDDVWPEGRRPEVSVVLPSYNHRAYIVQAIDSVLSQSLQHWELIVVDDGSSDGSPELLKARYGAHPQIRLVFQANQGAHRAINRGMALARGRYIAILNSDDVYHPERLQTLLAHCEAQPCGLAFTPVAPIDADGGPLLDPEHPWCRLYARLSRLYATDGARQALLSGNFAVSTSNFFFPAERIAQIGGFRKKRYNHDWDFMARLLQHGHALVCVGEQPLLSYRLHGRNTIHQNTLMARVELKRILQQLVPSGDRYSAALLAQTALNLRSMRREHEARLLQDLQAQLQQREAELAEQVQARAQLAQALAAAQDHLRLIHNSRSYRLAQWLARGAALFKKRSGP